MISCPGEFFHAPRGESDEDGERPAAWRSFARAQFLARTAESVLNSRGPHPPSQNGPTSRAVRSTRSSASEERGPRPGIQWAPDKQLCLYERLAKSRDKRRVSAWPPKATKFRGRRHVFKDPVVMEFRPAGIASAGRSNWKRRSSHETSAPFRWSWAKVAFVSPRQRHRRPPEPAPAAAPLAGNPRPHHGNRPAQEGRRHRRRAGRDPRRVSDRHRFRARVSVALLRAGHRRRQDAAHGRLHQLPAPRARHQQLLRHGART